MSLLNAYLQLLAPYDNHLFIWITINIINVGNFTSYTSLKIKNTTSICVQFLNWFMTIWIFLNISYYRIYKIING